MFENIGKLTKKSRKILGMTQKELSVELNYRNSQYISNLERSVCGIPAKKIAKYSEVLKIDKQTVIDAIVADTRVRLTKTAYGEKND
jgi:transcriptional regulator with XRE-family HTH domain